MKNNFLRDIKAKEDGTTLVTHTKAVMDRALDLLSVLSLTDEEYKILKSKIIIAAVLHDLGKIHPYFQKRLEGDRTYSIRHELVSLWFGLTYLDLDKDVLFAIATHHKNVVSNFGTKTLNIEDLDERFYNIYNNSASLMNVTVLQDWLKLMDVEIAIKENYEEKPNIETYMVNLLRYKSQPKNSTVEERQEFSLTRALLQAADHIASSGITDIPAYKLLALEHFQPQKDGVTYPFRHFQIIMQNWKGNVLLHAPTGSGKTEAALSWVFANQEPNSRLVYLLPYTASINAMVNRLQGVYGKERVIAQHSKSLNFIFDELCNESSNEEIDYRLVQEKARSINSLTREVYYPVKVATLHQILSRSLKGKGWEFSLLDYKNALFIIDEFHVYNALLTGMMLATIKMLSDFLNVRFMFMSATIPNFLIDKIINTLFNGDQTKLVRPDASFTSDAAVLNRKRHHLICCNNRTILDDIPLIEKLLYQGKSVLVIVNNVKTCQQVFNDIKFSGKKAMLHGGFNQKSRKEIERDITNNEYKKRPQLLVATQAVEVSLDIDYSVAFIENAPIDALIQRFGRVNRAGKLEDAEGNKTLAPVYLYKEIVGKTPFYDEEILNKTWNELQSLDDEDLTENDLINVCNNVYKDGYSEQQSKDFEQGLHIELFNRNWVAADCDSDILDKLEMKNMKVDVLCSNLEEEYRELIEQKRYIEASELLVSVYQYTTQLKNREIGGNIVKKADGLCYNSNIGYHNITPSASEFI